MDIDFEFCFIIINKNLMGLISLSLQENLNFFIQTDNKVNYQTKLYSMPEYYFHSVHVYSFLKWSSVNYSSKFVF